MNNASARFNLTPTMRIPRFLHALAFLAVLLAGVARVAGQDAQSLVFFSASGSYHGNGAGSPDLLLNGQSLSGGPATFSIGTSSDGNGGTISTTSMDFSIQANNLSDYAITFVAQPGFQVFIDGVCKETVTNNDPANITVTVVPAPSGPSAYVTGSTDQEPLGSASSVQWGQPYNGNNLDYPCLKFNMGLARNGQQLPPLQIFFQAGAGLNGSPAYPNVADATCSVQGNVQVITAPQVIATLTIGSPNFQLTFTRPNQSTPFATYVFTYTASNEFGIYGIIAGNMTVTKSMAGSSRVYETDFSETINRSVNPYSSTWAYDDWHEQGKPVQRHVNSTFPSYAPSASGYGPILMQVIDGNGTVATSTQFTYVGQCTTLGDGNVSCADFSLVGKIEGYGGPNTYSTNYYSGAQVNLQIGQTLPGGLTTMSALNVMLPASTYRTWCNQSPTVTYQQTGTFTVIPTFSANGSAETDYTYTNDWNGAAVLVHSARTSVSGTLLGQTTNNYDFSQNANGQPLVATTSAASVDTSGTTLTTISKTYRPDTPDSTYSGLPYSMQKPDGTKVDYAYEHGTYDGSQNFTPGNGGADLRITTLYGVASGGTTVTALSSGVQVDSIGLIANRSTETVDIRQNGFLVRRETWVYNGSSFEQLSWQNFSYTAAGCQASQQFSNGTGTSAIWDGDLETSSTDVDGLTTRYEYDSMGRLTATTRDAVGAVPAQRTTYAYDGDNRITATRVGPDGGEQLVTTKQYDTGGRLVSETSSSGVITNYSYTNGGQVVTKTFAPGTPAEASETTTYYADGRVQSITGNAVINQSHIYDFDAAGRPRHTVILGTSATSRSQTTMTDLLGRTVEEDTGGFGPGGSRGLGLSGSLFVTYNDYNTLGQLWRVRSVLRASGGSEQPLSANKLIQYDAFGAVTASGLDLDRSGSLDPGSTDRFISTSTTLSKDSSGVWWNVDTTQTYATDNSSAINQVQSYIQLSGLGSGTLSHTVSYDYYNNATTSTAQVNPSTHATVQTTIGPNGASTVQTTLSGLLTSEQVVDPSGAVQHSTTYAYDAQGRQVSTTDSRTGTAQIHYISGMGLVLNATDATGATVASYAYDGAGRVARTTDANGYFINTSYNTRGQLTNKSGSGVDPAALLYDDLGQQIQLSTYRDGTTPDNTKWTYDANTGWLTSKLDASGQQVAFDYQYTTTEKQVIRTWARGIKTTSHYSLTTGDLTGVTYSDGTPATGYTYNRDDTLNTVADATGTRDFTYTKGQITAVALDPTWYNGLVHTLIYQTATSATSVPGRFAGFYLGYATPGNADQELSIAYGYDNLGRLGGVTANYRAQGTTRPALSVPFTYHYASQSGLWDQLQLTQGSFNIGRTFEPNRDVLTHISANWNNTVLAHYAYSTNTAGQRLSSSQDGSAFADYGGATGYTYQYDSFGQLTNAVKSVGGSPLPGASFGYTYDYAGNRKTVSVDTENANYGANALNQVTSRDTLKTRFSGTADPGASISVGSATVTRQGRYWDAEPLGFGSNAQVNVSATLGSQSQSASLWGLQRPASESPNYDLDGNLTGDSAWTYQYDAENRLVSMTTKNYAFAAPNSTETINFTYDYMGRRVRKTVTLNGSVVSDHKYVYRNWLLMADLDATTQKVVRSYVWGLDASGSSPDGAGGVGGLVLETVHTASTLTPYGVAFDGNGNVAALVNTASSGFGAIYEYDPFGQLMHSEGAEAANNPFQFSTKYRDRETGLVYYGHRYYDPSLGRFINRDPAEESGGVNLYGFVGNNPVNDWDYLGLNSQPDCGGGSDPNQNPLLNPGGEYSNVTINDHDYALDSNGNVTRGLMGSNGTYYVVPVGNLSQVGLTVNDINNTIAFYGTNNFATDSSGFNYATPLPTEAFGADNSSANNGFNSPGNNWHNFDPTYSTWIQSNYIDEVKADNLRIKQQYDQKLAQIERVYGNVERANADNPFAGLDELASFAEFGANFSVGFIGGVEAKLGQALTDAAFARDAANVGANSAMQAQNLARQLTSEEQMAQALAGNGEAMAGAGTGTVLRDTPRLVSEYGGDAVDWAKMGGESSAEHGIQTPGGNNFEIHWYQNVKTGQIVEIKTKIGN